MNTYDIFQGHDLKIADRIQQLRLCLLVHSCIYYELNYNRISDKEWDSMARELKALQEQYPNISKQVIWYDAFKDWDASTGAFLPLKDEWVMKKAQSMVRVKPPKKSVKQAPAKKKGALF